MKPTTKPRVKICCIRNVEEAWMAIEAGASPLRLVSNMPSGPGVIPEPLIAEIVTAIPPGVAIVQVVHAQGPGSVDEAVAAA